MMKLDKQSLNIEMITKNTELLGQKEQENNKRGERERRGKKKKETFTTYKKFHFEIAIRSSQFYVCQKENIHLPARRSLKLCLCMININYYFLEYVR